MDTRTFVKAVLERYSKKALFPPMKTRLVKLLYLTELEYFRRTGRRLTSIDWQFYHFGPYATALEPYIGDPDAITREDWFDDMLAKVRGETVPPDQDLQHAVVDVVHDWGNADLNTLLDYVYFETEPMQAAKRGEALNFSTVERAKPESLSVHLDSKKIRRMRDEVRKRSAAYAQLRHPTIGPDDLFSNLLEWDSERSSSLSPGSCDIDPQKLKP